MRKIILLSVLLTAGTMLIHAQSLNKEKAVSLRDSQRKSTSQVDFKKQSIATKAEGIDHQYNAAIQKNTAFSATKGIVRKSTTADIEAGFKLPEATFFVGLTGDFSYYYYTFLLGPAYYDVTWRNTSDEGSYSWSIPDPDGTQDSYGYVISNTTSTDQNPVLNYPYGIYISNPSLTVTTADGFSNYTFGPEDSTYFLMGGNTSLLYYTGVGNYNPNGDLYYTDIKDDDFGVYAMANFFEKPAHKYILDSLYISARDVDFPAGTELTVIIHQMVETTQASSTVYIFGDTLATSTVSVDDLIGPSYNDILYSIPFEEFSVYDEELGYNVDEDYIDIDDAILIELKGFYGVDGTLTSYAEFTDEDSGSENNAYLLYTDENDELALASFSGYNASFCVNLGIIYSYLTSDDTVFNAPIAGGSKTFDLNSYYSPDAFWLDEDLPSWLTLESSFDEETWEISLTFTATALPDGTADRSTEVTVYSYGAELTFFIDQKEGNSISINNQKEVSVFNNNGQFEVSYPDKAQQLDVYSITGQLIGKYNLPSGGKTTIVPQNMTNGVYLMVVTGANNYKETVKVVY